MKPIRILNSEKGWQLDQQAAKLHRQTFPVHLECSQDPMVFHYALSGCITKRGNLILVHVSDSISN